MRAFLEIDGPGEIPSEITLVHILVCLARPAHLRLCKTAENARRRQSHGDQQQGASSQRGKIVHRGDESMKIMAKVGEFVNKKGIRPALPGADKIQFVPMDKFNTKARLKRRRSFRKTFLW